MTSIAETLQKILSLEEAQGLKNRAVYGGLERFAATWKEEAAPLHPKKPVEEIARLLQEYSKANPAQRRRVIAKIRNLLAAPPPKVKEKKESYRKPKRESRDLEAPVTVLSGVREAMAERLARLGIETVSDLLYHFPHRYEDYSALKKISQLEYGEEATIMGTIWERHERDSRRGKRLTTCLISDGTGTVQATWFNLPLYLVRQLREGEKLVFSGRVAQYLGRPTFEHPDWEPVDQELIHTGRLVPIYPLTEGVGPRWLRRVTKGAVDRFADLVQDPVSDNHLESHSLLPLPIAIHQIHFPDNWEMLTRARRRLAFDEFLFIQLGVLKKRREWKEAAGQPIAVDHLLLHEFLDSLPFRLTTAQSRALEEILRDLESPQPMSRLLQGEVGSGKTVVAAAAMLTAVAGGAQAALMAPTEILAEQHLATLQKLFGGVEIPRNGNRARAPIQVRLLIGSLSPSERDQIYQEVAAGRAQVLIGTHALIQSGLEFHNLGLVVIDEQHRFGVRQRQTLRQKAASPHVLVMSATPIPRTLALTLYGDLDISIIEELPPGRQKITTRWLRPTDRDEAYASIRKEVEKDHQAFIVCPLIDESEKIEAAAATDEYERLKGVFPDLRLGLLHGRLGTQEKDQVMRSFYEKELDILVATPVVEVGIDVPNATVLLVEGADRFGLAQLHQFRGRIGRGPAPSHCLLLSQSPSEQAMERLKIIETTDDGFRLAEEDLRIRGPGDFFGTRQSGLPELKVARLSDVGALEQAREVAKVIFRDDPDLEKPEHRLLAQKVAAFWTSAGELS